MKHPVSGILLQQPEWTETALSSLLFTAMETPSKSLNTEMGVVAFVGKDTGVLWGIKNQTLGIKPQGP